ncbi:helix-turn-helix domain-containing protein [Algoriphagus boritolerans]|uniref:HTH-type transcriptional regulator / antitoxin HigA n=1 Tax=Algoriphagus boritolerans DSM 17298 = JCM 18970 TaxID=1120964 RepID=A0A1H5WYG4_9BACT|nr:transcriptional regulator [Algoriphagus boritolerans]SEG04521.1 HTH-type transcriptional regulator / antitoxin HigA [Algoriphagus boritolerans DSM 17298 = JCM 18970]
MELIDKPKLKILETNAEYEQALEYVKYLIDEGFALPGTEEENTLEVLSVLIEKYEEEKGYKLEGLKSDPIDWLNYFLEEKGLQQKDLIPALGPASRVSEILNKKRPLSLRQIKNLRDEFNIPVQLLIK